MIPIIFAISKTLGRNSIDVSMFLEPREEKNDCLLSKFEEDLLILEITDCIAPVDTSVF